ncbi:Acid phosphatase [Plasmodium coatneyi]|uniref:diphosphoinositol-pentakisphosphate 1-kinase n=1 Tax=Plasmodium coatneyi TaxID=208452 RepID=A0A1B1E636_9APIC|nr:Acid phosphatase [Plasmodium coatneyi]ANQ10448.1 Acid phosphatase [Plasmodium coatneyi]
MKLLRKHGGSLDEEKLFENVSKDDSGMIKKFTLGVCAMESKVESAPMECILKRLAKSGDFNIIKFKGDMILNHDIDSWPIVDCLIAFYSTGFPLKKAIEYVKKYKPITLNNLSRQLILRSRLQIYEELKKWKVPHANYVVVDHDAVKRGEHAFEEYYDYIVYNNIRLNKPFIEKPINADNHNNWIYYPKNTGGGCKKLFRKVKDRSSEYCPDVHKVRNNGTYIYEEFLSTFGTDVKVYTVGQMFAHAEARKSPALDGKVCRTSDGKEVRYAVILSEAEKIIAYRIVEAFQQTVCGFDILRTTMGPFVCDVNGWSFVKGNIKYYNDCAHILRAMFLAKLEEKYNIIPRDLADNWYNIENEEEVLRKTFRQPDDLHCSHHEELCSVIIVMRHGDRKPKQKMKFLTDRPLLLDYFNCEENLYNVIEKKLSPDDQTKPTHIDLNNANNNSPVSCVPSDRVDSSMFQYDAATKASPTHSKISFISQKSGQVVSASGKEANPNDVTTAVNAANSANATNATNAMNTLPADEEERRDSLYKEYTKKEIKFKSPEELQDLFLRNNIILGDIEKEYKALKAEAEVRRAQQNTITDPVGRTDVEASLKGDAITPKVDAITPKVDAITPKVDAITPKVDAITPKADVTVGRPHAAMTQEELEAKLSECQITIENHKTLQKVLERGDGFTGINRKIQLKPVEFIVLNDKIVVTKILTVAKWGGELTRMGRRQSENLGKRFRATLYPGDSDGLLRLHSTFRHDFKIFTSDEGRCQITSAAFTKGFLDLDGELTPILVAMVIRNSKAHSLLDDNRPSLNRTQCKQYIDNLLNEDKDIDEDLLKKLTTGKHARGLRESLRKISNFFQLMEKIRKTIYDFLKGLNQEVQKWLNLFPYDEYALYVIDILHEIQVRWKSLTKMWFRKNKNNYDTSKIPDIVDNIRFDLIHHHSYLGCGLDKAFEIYNQIEPLANFISQAEYGITPEEKVKIGVNIVGKLLRKLIHDVTFYRDEEVRNKRNNKGYFDLKNALNISYINSFNPSKGDKTTIPTSEKNPQQQVLENAKVDAQHANWLDKEMQKDTPKLFSMCKYDSRQIFIDNRAQKNGEQLVATTITTDPCATKSGASVCNESDSSSVAANSTTAVYSSGVHPSVTHPGAAHPSEAFPSAPLSCVTSSCEMPPLNEPQGKKSIYRELNRKGGKLGRDAQAGVSPMEGSSPEVVKNRTVTEPNTDVESKTDVESTTGVETNGQDNRAGGPTGLNGSGLLDRSKRSKGERPEEGDIRTSDRSPTEVASASASTSGDAQVGSTHHVGSNVSSNVVGMVDTPAGISPHERNPFKATGGGVTYNVNAKDLYAPKLINKKEALVINSSDLWAHQNKYRKENNEKQKMKKIKNAKDSELNLKREDHLEVASDYRGIEKKGSRNSWMRGAGGISGSGSDTAAKELRGKVTTRWDLHKGEEDTLRSGHEFTNQGEKEGMTNERGSSNTVQRKAEEKTDQEYQTEETDGQVESILEGKKEKKKEKEEEEVAEENDNDEEGEEEQDHDDDEDIIRLKETDARRLGIRSPWRMVRSRYYVTSASHMISLLSILIHAKNIDSSTGQNIIDNDSIKSVGDVTDLHYLSHLVFRVWERKQLKRNDSNRFRIEILFSSGAKDGFGQNYELLEKDAKAQQQKYERHFSKYVDDSKRGTGGGEVNPSNQVSRANSVVSKGEKKPSGERPPGETSPMEKPTTAKNDHVASASNKVESNNSLSQVTPQGKEDKGKLNPGNAFQFGDNVEGKAAGLGASKPNLQCDVANTEKKGENSIDGEKGNLSRNNCERANMGRSNSALRNDTSLRKDIFLRKDTSPRKDAVRRNGLWSQFSSSSANLFRRTEEGEEDDAKFHHGVYKRDMSFQFGGVHEKLSSINKNTTRTGSYMVRSISSNLRKKKYKQKDGLNVEYEKKKKEDITKENLLTYEHEGTIDMATQEGNHKIHRSVSCVSDRSFYVNPMQVELEGDANSSKNFNGRRNNFLENESGRTTFQHSLQHKIERPFQHKNERPFQQKSDHPFEKSSEHDQKDSKKANVFSHVFQHFNENKKNSTSNLKFFYKTYMPDYEKIIENDKKAETFDVPPYCELAPLIVLTKNCQLSTFENILTQILNKYSKSGKGKDKGYKAGPKQP